MRNIVITVVGIAALSFLINGAANWLDMQPSPPDQKFAVVDRYNDRCEVVRYTPDNSARYTYFLDCKK
jgi:hypothetical protein